MSEDVPGLVALFVLLALNAFFVGAEFAVISAKRSQIEPKADAGSKAAKTTLWAMEHVTLMLATGQLGITVCSLLILNVSEPAIHHLLSYPLGALFPGSSPGETGQVADVVAFAIALVLVTFLHVVFGEMIPKNLAFSVPTRAALLLAPPLVVVSRIFRPLIWTLNTIANHVLRLFKVEPKDEAASSFTLEEVANIVAQSTREGTLSDTNGTLTAAFEFTEKKVRDVEVPLSEMVVLGPLATPAEVQAAVAEHGYSRYILTDDRALPHGYLHLKDVLDLTGAEERVQPIPAKRIRTLSSVARDADLEDALAAMRQAGSHVATSYDTEGTATGVLFLEDIIEELVGEVQDASSSAD